MSYATLVWVLRKLFKALLYIDNDILSMLSTPYRFKTVSNAMPVLESSLLYFTKRYSAIKIKYNKLR